MVVSPAIERPATAEELAKRVGDLAGEGIGVIPVGGGRAAGMGDVSGAGVEIHTVGLDRVIEHSQADMVATVEAGLTLEALQAELAKAGQFLPLDPFNSPGHTIGGLIAAGWSGPLRLRYGTARDFLIGIRVALPDGRLASAGGRVVKNVTGYDLMKLHYGALGALGVVVAASFKLFPKPLHDVTLELPGGDLVSAWAAAERALALPQPPAALELDSSGRVLVRFMGSQGAVDKMARALGWPEAGNAVWAELAAQAPPVWARIATPRKRLQSALDRLPAGARWWASPGVGLAHWSVDFNIDSIAQVRSAVEAVGGSLVLLNAPDDLKRSIGAWGAPPKSIDLMRRIKLAYDPRQVMNPGRFVV
jgi:glycolate oxidase FAD binding subunit